LFDRIDIKFAGAGMTLINPQNGNLAFRVFNFENDSPFDHLQRLNYYVLLLVLEGEGNLKADFSSYEFTANNLLCFAPYQPFLIDAKASFRGVAVNFHPDFFCIHRHHTEVACNGILFNNIYQPPFHVMPAAKATELSQLVDAMKKEMVQPELAQYELLVSYLKIFLITASRSRLEQLPEEKRSSINNKEPFVLQQLKDAIEQHYRKKHSAGDYASLLNLSPKTLARITKTHFNKTLTRLIAERIIIEAKRELYLTSKPVKTIAWELGFDDEYYFSRFFKTHTDISPLLYRESVGFARNEENAKQ
jgi:AraC family transcriptional regulator, transcriptional activator of pobA